MCVCGHCGLVCVSGWQLEDGTTELESSKLEAMLEETIQSLEKVVASKVRETPHQQPG